MEGGGPTEWQRDTCQCRNPNEDEVLLDHLAFHSLVPPGSHIAVPIAPSQVPVAQKKKENGNSAPRPDEGNSPTPAPASVSEGPSKAMAQWPDSAPLVSIRFRHSVLQQLAAHQPGQARGMPVLMQPPEARPPDPTSHFLSSSLPSLPISRYKYCTKVLPFTSLWDWRCGAAR